MDSRLGRVGSRYEAQRDVRLAGPPRCSPSAIVTAAGLPAWEWKTDGRHGRRDEFQQHQHPEKVEARGVLPEAAQQGDAYRQHRDHQGIAGHDFPKGVHGRSRLSEVRLPPPFGGQRSSTSLRSYSRSLLGSRSDRSNVVTRGTSRAPAKPVGQGLQAAAEELLMAHQRAKQMRPLRPVATDAALSPPAAQ